MVDEYVRRNANFILYQSCLITQETTGPMSNALLQNQSINCNYGIFITVIVN